MIEIKVVYHVSEMYLENGRRPQIYPIQLNNKLADVKDIRFTTIRKHLSVRTYVNMSMKNSFLNI